MSTTMKLAVFSLFGQRGAARRVTADGRVRYDAAAELPVQALCRRIEREARVGCWRPRVDSKSLDGTRTVYQITLVRRIADRDGGGYSVEGSLWATVARGGSR